MIDEIYFENSLRQWILAAGIAVSSYIVLILARRIIASRLKAFARRTSTDIDDLIIDLLGRTRALFLVVLSLYIASHFLVLSPVVLRIIQTVTILSFLLQAAAWGNGAITYWVNRSMKQRLEQDAASATTLGALGFLGRVLLWTAIFLLALDNLGVNITALIAGLGVGGIAVALALQNILGDLFASLSIVLDKPFVIGDTITVDTLTGKVEHIGLKTTRVRSVDGDQIVFSNSDLLQSRVRNVKRMSERRAAFMIRVTYQTPAEKLQEIPTLLKTIVEAQASTRFDRAHFKEFGESALVFEAAYYILDPDYLLYMDTQEKINLEICKRFATEGIQFAYPTRSLYLHTMGEEPADPSRAPRS